METNPVKVGMKQRLMDDLIEYAINTAYLALFFGIIMTYKRLILRTYSISYMHYGISILEALIMAKVILLIDAMHLGRKHEDKALAYSTAWKAAVFTVGVLMFSLLEHAVKEMIHDHTWRGLRAVFASADPYEMTANSMVVFVAFIPFFAFKELARVLGEGKIVQLFFRQRIVADPTLKAG